MRTEVVALLICLSSTAAQAAKCRSGTKITNEYDLCPPGYTDITGQKYGEVFGFPPCTAQMPTGCRLPNDAEEGRSKPKEPPQIWKEPKKSGL